MLHENLAIKTILGLKIRELRTQMNYSFHELSEITGLSLSYLNEIEKGKKYPKGDKILALAKALQVEYDELVSLKVTKKLQPIADLLQSNFLKDFPLELFGLDAQKIIELVSINPEKTNAFINSIIQIARNYEMRQEHFNYSALRSFQELNDNYFEDLEQLAVQFRTEHKIKSVKVPLELLEQLLKNNYGITVDYTTLQQQKALQHMRSVYNKSKKILYISNGLTAAQINFLLARELGFQYLKLAERPFETPPLEAESFEQLLHNFRASYFAVAVLMDAKEVIKDVRKFAKSKAWNPEEFLAFLSKYEATPEMLMQRLSNLLPQYFGLNNFFFLRLIGAPDRNWVDVTKELHLSNLHNPHENRLNEHYCRRWVSITSIEQLKNNANLGGPIASIQVSNYLNTNNSYLCITIAKRNESNAQEMISVTIGFLVNQDLKNKIKLLDDPNVPSTTVHTTCERCSLTNCTQRVIEPLKIQENELLMQKQAAIQLLLAP